MIVTASNLESDANQRILVRSTNWLGDSVMTLPALERLRESRPGAFIALLTKPGLVPLFTLSALVNETIVYEKSAGGPYGRTIAFLSLVGKVRQRHFDTAILFQSAFEAALIAFMAGIPNRVGYSTQGRALLLTHTVTRPASSEPRHEMLDYLALVEAATGAMPSRESRSGPSIVASEEQTRLASALLVAQGAGLDGRPLVLLNPGATNSEAKRWPETHFAELADRFADELNAQIALVGAVSERALSSKIQALARHSHPLNLAGLTDLPTLIGVLALSTVVVSNDTGTAHVSAALGLPTLTIFGPTNEYQTAPLGPRSEVIRAPGIDCERCMLRQCPIDHRCMTRISSGEVFSRAQRLLS